MNESLLNPRKFLNLFNIQFLNVVNDNVLKNATMVLVVYYSLTFFHLRPSVIINIITFIFVLPLFLFSSYAGKIADYYSKIKIIRIIKICEIAITSTAIAGIYYKNIWLLLLAIILLSTHSAFFSPIKYSILPQYFTDRKKLLLANSLIEVGSFVAILIGQFIGSWFIGNRQPQIIIGILFFSTLISLTMSFFMEVTPAIRNRSSFTFNIIRDNYRLYSKIITDNNIKTTLHTIGWFWAIGAIYSTQIATLTLHNIGGNAQVFSVIIAELSVAIGVGSFICNHLSNGHIRKGFICLGAAGMSFFTILLLIIAFEPTNYPLSLKEFSESLRGITIFALIFLLGICAGFYSITCYNELQVISPIKKFSQIISVNNIMNAAYILVAIAVNILLLIRLNSWDIFAVISAANLIFAYVYYKKVLHK